MKAEPSDGWGKDSLMRALSLLSEANAAHEEIEKLQSGAINELLLLLGQHMGDDEAQALPAVRKVNEAARIYTGMARRGLA